MGAMPWIDTHCHFDAREFLEPNRPLAPEVRAQAAAKGVVHCVIPAVDTANFDTVRILAQRFNDSYCLGIHPLYVKQATPGDLQTLEDELRAHIGDPRLVAVGEIGLDYFVPELCENPLREKQEFPVRYQMSKDSLFLMPISHCSALILHLSPDVLQMRKVSLS